MSLTLQFAPGGCASPVLLVEIADAAWEIHDYLFELAPLDGADWACTLHRTYADSRPTYRVAFKDALDAASCTCADHEFRGFKKRDTKECKHVRVARELRALHEWFVAQLKDRIERLPVPKEEEYPCPPL